MYLLGPCKAIRWIPGFGSLPRYGPLGLLLVSLACQTYDDVPSSEFELVQMRRIGALDGPEAFGLIGALAAHPNGTLAVYDRASCEIVLVDIDALSIVRRIGGCGEGPGEFGFVYSLALTGDSIFAFDRHVHGVKVLDYDGNEGRILRLGHLRELGVRRPGLLGILDDTTWVVRLYMNWSHGMPPGGAVLNNNLIAHIDARSGSLLSSYHRDDELSIGNRLGAVRNVVACMSATPPGGVGAYSHFTFEGAMYARGETTATAEFRLGIDWASPTPMGPSAWLWPEGYFYASCSDEFAVFSFQSVLPGTSRVKRGYLEIRDFRGDVKLTRELSPADSALFGQIAAVGDRIYVASNSVFEHPMIHEFELRRRASPRPDEASTVATGDTQSDESY